MNLNVILCVMLHYFLSIFNFLFSNLTRLQRNVAEKQRRDKLNGYISELATIVPMVSMSSKRLDKTSILRLSAAHLRLSKSKSYDYYHSLLLLFILIIA